MDTSHPLFRNFENARTKKTRIPYPYWLEFRVYYPTDQFFVVGRALIASSEDLKRAAALVPEAERRALA